MTTGSASSILGGGGVPVGAYIQAIDAPVNFTQSGQEYLRAGSIKAYDSSYASAIANAPQLRVFGNDAKTYGTVTGTQLWRYYYTGTVYQAIGMGSSIVQQGAALNSLSSANNLPFILTNIKRAAVGGAYLVVPRNATANTAPMYSLSGGAWTSVGGTFTTFPITTAICFGNNSWLALSTIQNSAGEQAYINAANPSGTWTVGASGLSTGASSPIRALSYGAGVFVAVAYGNASTTSKIFTCPTVGGAWTDRTPASGITFQTTETMLDVVFNGTAHVAITSLGRCISSADGINWTLRASPFDFSDTAMYGSNSNFAQAITQSEIELQTDAGGTVICQSVPVSGPLARRVVFAISTDHGATWAVAQPYLGKVGTGGNASTRSMSYANGRWIENHSADYQSLVDIGTSLATPDYVGQQNSGLGIGQFVRIK